MKKIIIGGITGLRNRGVHALLKTIIDVIEENTEEVEFTVHSHSPKYDERVFNRENVSYIRDDLVKFFRNSNRKLVFDNLFLRIICHR